MLPIEAIEPPPIIPRPRIIPPPPLPILPPLPPAIIPRPPIHPPLDPRLQPWAKHISAESIAVAAIRAGNAKRVNPRAMPFREQFIAESPIRVGPASIVSVGIIRTPVGQSTTYFSNPASLMLDCQAIKLQPDSQLSTNLHWISLFDE